MSSVFSCQTYPDYGSYPGYQNQYMNQLNSPFTSLYYGQTNACAYVICQNKGVYSSLKLHFSRHVILWFKILFCNLKQCVPTVTSPQGFVCSCKFGYSGVTCQTSKSIYLSIK